MIALGNKIDGRGERWGGLKGILEVLANVIDNVGREEVTDVGGDNEFRIDDWAS